MNAVITEKTKIHIATGGSRFETLWKNRSVTWDQLADRLAKSRNTGESHAAYMSLSKTKQDQVKDIGGFVGGWLKDGHRGKQNVLDRSVITLDADNVPDLQEFIGQVENVGFINAVLYSTHKHTPEKPRLRLIIQLNKAVEPDAYQAIARKLAERIGMEFFDPTTFQAERLMYWPSHSSDVEPFYKRLVGDPVDADEILSEYPDWHDISYWPMAEGEKEIRKKAEKAADPLEKDGPVGIFCRAYSIPDAISTFLPDVYVEGRNGRYTYKAGSGSNGLVIYGDGRWAYSNHSTDPASLQLCNSFDLVRIHKFGDLDADGSKTGAAAPSYKAMCEFAAEDSGYKAEYFSERQQSAEDDFKAPVDAWKNQLVLNKKTGQLSRLIQNLIIILQNDPALQGISYNELSGVITARKPLPWNDIVPRAWTDADDVQLYAYIESNYGQLPKQMICDAVAKIADDNRFNPIRDYLEGLPPWDGRPRVETLLVDYLGAEDTPYTRAVTKNTLTAAVRRIYEPGVKFDYMLVLVGKPAIGKSTLWNKLGGQWFSDSLALDDMRDKTAAEKLQGFWILEIGEMQGARRADVNNVKSFLSRQSDNYRPAYGHYVIEHPRSCIIVGTTNEEDGFLKDLTGNRRFWPVPCYRQHLHTVWELTAEDIGQIWAEVLEMNKTHEPLNLPDNIEIIAAEKQRDMLESDDRAGLVQEYLDTPLPENWYAWPVDKRIEYFQTEEAMREQGTMRRDYVCAMEIWTECFGSRKGSYDSYRDGRAIGTIMAKLDGWEKASNPLRIPGYGKPKAWGRMQGPSGVGHKNGPNDDDLPF